MENDEMLQIQRAIAETKQQLVDLQEDEKSRFRDTAIAVRRGLAQESKQYLPHNAPVAVEQKKPASGVPKGIPMTMIRHQEPDKDGVSVQFVPGEIQEKEAKQKEADTRLPTLPELPHTEGFRDNYDEFVDSMRLQNGASQAAIELPNVDDNSLPTLSVLQEYPGFYVHCKSFLPKAAPEQHFEVFGIPQQLTREQWDAFVLRCGK